MSKIYVKPQVVDGVVQRVLLPRASTDAPFPEVPPAGMWLEPDTFVMRRLHFGCLVETTPPADAPASDQTPAAISAPAAKPAKGSDAA